MNYLFLIKFVLVLSLCKYYWQNLCWSDFRHKLCQSVDVVQYLCFLEWNYHMFYATVLFIRAVCCCHFYVWIFNKLFFARNYCSCRDTW